METNHRYLMIDSPLAGRGPIEGGIHLCKWIPPRRGQYWVTCRGGATYAVRAHGDYTADEPCWTVKTQVTFEPGEQLMLTPEQLRDVSPPVSIKTKIRLRFNWEQQ